MSLSRFVAFVLYCLYLVQTSYSASVLEMFAKAVNLCHRKHNTSLSDCVKERSLIALDNVYRSENEINLISDFITLVRCGNTDANERSAKVLLSDIENESPQNKSTIVDSLIVRRIYDFLESRAVNVKIPITVLDVFGILEDADAEEGRSKETGRGKKDKGGMMAVGAMFAGTMMAMKLAAVAALAGKALMASMMATIFAAVAALSKKSSTHGSTYEVINVPSQGHHSKRSMVDATYSKRYRQQGEPTTYNDIPEIDRN